MALRFLCFITLLVWFSPTVAAQVDPCGLVSISNGDELAICQGEEVTFNLALDLPGATVTWSPAGVFGDQVNSTSPTIEPEFSGFYRVTASGPAGCVISDSVFIDVDRLVVPLLIEPQTVCQGSRINLLSTPVTDVGNTTYELISGGVTLAQGTDPNFTVRVDSAATYTLVATSENGSCTERQSVALKVVDGFFDIPQDTVFACLGTDSITLTVIDTPAMDRIITWSPDRFSNGMPQGNTFRVAPTADVTYFARTTINGCERVDSVAVRLDSLPNDLSLTVDPEKDPYCQGDTFYVRTPTFDVGDFPLIESDWVDAPGLQSPRELLSAVFVAQDTALLTRITRNGACTDTAQVLVNVVEPPVVTFSPIDPVVCPGEPLQITATFESGEGTFDWQEAMGTLSCTDCLDPIATVNTDIEYTIEVSSSGSQCASDLSYAITVDPAVNPILTDAVNICPGDSRQLIVGNIDSTSTYRITGGGVELTDPLGLVSPTETTTYTIETTGECGTFTREITLVVGGAYSVTASGPETICAREDLVLNASVDPETEGTYSWTLPGGVVQTGQQITVVDPIAGTYAVTFRDADGCGSSTDSLSVEILDDDIIPVIQGVLDGATVLASGGTVFGGNTVELTVTNLPADRNFTYSWSGNYEPATGTTNPLTVTIPRVPDGQQPTDLVYTVTVTSEDGGCTFTDTYSLNVEQSQVQIPDFFTPDNDGRNDRFRMFFNGQISDYTMIVYDRWGQKVFTSDNPTEGWDGTKDGTPQNADVYLYLARFRQDGVEVEEEGQVSLLR
ncbi:gliding motility-associated C-terminal domain-containing protein [Neolewinella sp.]|uniref:gliding motility-associated C-terminal domain-containing protein n=1 Tax=Neolewinella sp. TaxID=2993543 RepID=UPI003B5189A1